MAKRINVILEDETAQAINRAAKAGERSRFINRAVQYYAATHGPDALRERLKQAALRDHDLAEGLPATGVPWTAKHGQASSEGSAE